MTHRPALFALLLTACEGDIPRGSTTDSSWGRCGDIPPQIMGEIAVGGGQNPETGTPTVWFGVVATDDDGAMHTFSVEAWVDADMDRSVDTNRPPDARFDIDATDAIGLGQVQICDQGGGFPMLLHAPVEGVGLPFDHRYEAMVQVIDADGWRSEQVYGSGCTSTADGEPGCAQATP